MPTATMSTTDRLAQLVSAREKARDALDAEQHKRATYEAETRAQQAALSVHHQTHPKQYEQAGAPLPGTEAAKLSTAFKERMGGQGLLAAAPYPHSDKLDEQLAGFHRADAECETFRAEALPELIAEVVDPGLPAEIEQALREVVDLCDRYRQSADRVRTVAVEANLSGQHVGSDERVGRLRETALRFGDEVTQPGLTELGHHRLEVVRESHR